MAPTTRIVSRDALRLAQRSGMQVGHAVTVEPVPPSEPYGWRAYCTCGASVLSRVGIVDARRRLAGHETREAADASV